jgi:redox-sensitive bicupin YhaK (pirin superfamily)
MITVRRSGDRGLSDGGWLHSQHTFSFSEYYDPKHMGFGVLRVINEDQIEGGTGFPTHPHRDMEIISYVIEGALEHQDTMGNKTIIKPGEIQRMSAGTGIQHSEQNHLKDKKTHFLQIWIMPDKKDYKPSYGQMEISSRLACTDFAMIASHLGKENTITLNQDVDIYLGRTKPGSTAVHKTFPQRKTWIQVIKGRVKVEGETLEKGDGAGLEGLKTVELEMGPDTDLLLFDLP